MKEKNHVLTKKSFSLEKVVVSSKGIMNGFDEIQEGHIGRTKQNFGFKMTISTLAREKNISPFKVNS